MSPLALWCCEAQERYVLLVNASSLNRFVSICSELNLSTSNTYLANFV